MTATDLMLLGSSADSPGITLLHLDGGRWRMQPPPADQIAPGAVLGNVETMLEGIVAELDDPAVGGYLDAMQGPMQTLFNSLLPGELRRKLMAEADSATPEDPPVLRLHLQDNLDRFPWELMHDGTDFLGLRYRIARMPLVGGGPKVTNGTPRTVRSISSLLGENVLRAAQQDAWSGTFGALANGTVALTLRPDADNWPTLSALKDPPADVLYLVCHGLRDDQGVFWSLNDNKPNSIALRVRPDQVQTLNLQLREPLVFANACHPLGGRPGASTHDVASGRFGFQFYSAGASAFVGAIAPISKRVALPFARAFFEQLFTNHRPIGGALLDAKRQFRNAPDPADPSYLFYALYGDPDTTFEAGA